MKPNGYFYPSSGITDELRTAMNAIHGQLMKTIILAVLICGIPIIAASFFRAQAIGWRGIMAVHLGAYLALLAVALSWRRLSPSLRALIMIGILFVTGMADLFQTGLIGVGVFLLTMCCIYAAIFLGARIGMAFLGAGAVVMTGVGLAAYLGRTTIDFNLQTYSASPTSWLFVIVTFGVFTGTVVVLSGQLYGFLLSSIRDLRQRTAEHQAINRKLAEEIAEKERAAEALRKSEAKLQSLFRAAPTGIGLVSDRVLLEVNDRVCRMVDRSRGELIGKSARILYPTDEDFDFVGQEKYARIRAHGTGTVETRWMRQDGTIIDVLLSSSPLDSKDLSAGVTFTALDITHHKRMEEEAELHRQQLIQADKMVSLGTLVAGVAHEINNPNGFVRAGIDVLQPVIECMVPILDDYYREHGDFAIGHLGYMEARTEIPQVLQEIRKGTDRISRIIGELRDFARQRPVEMREDVDINAVVEAAITLLSNLIRQSTRRFEVDLSQHMPLVRGDSQRLEQVIVNLIMNACQALPSHDRGIRVATRCDREKHEAIIEVQDEGTGIAPEHLPRVTDPFFTTKREKGGSGLGLSVSSRIIMEHRGRLEFDSKLGEGTTVTVILPDAGDGK